MDVRDPDGLVPVAVTGGEMRFPAIDCSTAAGSGVGDTGTAEGWEGCEYQGCAVTAEPRGARACSLPRGWFLCSSTPQASVFQSPFVTEAKQNPALPSHYLP